MIYLQKNLIKVILIAFLMPCVLNAQPVPGEPKEIEITTEEGLKNAAKEGGAYFTKQKIILTGPVDVTSNKFSLRGDPIKEEENTPNEPAIDGNKKQQIVGNGTQNLFNIKVESATFSMLELTGGKAVSVTNATSTTASGGAINILYNKTPTEGTTPKSILIENTSFNKNTSAIESNGNVFSRGGAISIDSTQSLIIKNGEFNENKVTAASLDGGTAEASGGAIYSIGSGKVGIDSTKFSKNEAQQGGGAISNASGEMKITESIFDQNKAGVGGAIVTFSKLDLASSTFTANEAASAGGALYTFAGSDTSVRSTIFKNNKAATMGGAIFHEGQSLSVNSSTFEANEATMGGAISAVSDLNIGNAVHFKHNKATAGNGGAVHNIANLTVGASSFTGNTTTGNGGAIYTDNSTGKGTLTLTGGIFTDNKADGLGGAIYADTVKVNIFAQTDVSFSGNKDLNGSSAIYLKDSTLNLNAGLGSINFGDKITGTASSIVNINASHADNADIPEGTLSTGAVNFSTTQDAFTGTINAYGGTLGFTGDINFAAASFNASNVHINMLNKSINHVTIDNLSLSGSNTIAIDIDPLNAKIDTFNSANGATGTLVIGDVKITTEALSQLSGPLVVSDDLTIVVDENRKYYGAVFIYTLLQNDEHSLLVNKTDDLTPTVLSSSIAQNAVFANNMLISRSLMDRVGVMLSRDGRYYDVHNSYSLSKHDKFLNNDSFKIPGITQQDWYTTWFVPYAAKTSMNLGFGVEKVDNNSYGATAGVDLPVILLKNDFGFIPTIFAGYGGANQKYSGLDINDDALLFGVMGTLYKEDFLATMEMHVSNGSTVARFDGQSDRFDVFSFTTAAKAEYALHLFGAMQLRPGIMAAYNLNNAQNYVTELGANMKVGVSNTVQITPSLKLMTDINGWHPYLSASYSWNAWGNSNTKANNLKLPQFAVEDYLEYGIGVENTFLEKYSGYAQVTGYTNGVSGFAMQIGLRGYID